MSSWIGSLSWLVISISSLKPLATARRRVTDRCESTYTVPVVSASKNWTLKYACSSTESVFGRMPLMVRIQRDRKRVSSRNRPWLSVGVASMSPRRSLTTNMLPSRMLTVLSDMGSRVLSVERGVDERGARAQAEDHLDAKFAVAVLADLAAQRRHDRVELAPQQLHQQLTGRAPDGHGDTATVLLQRQVSVVDHQHAMRLIAHHQAYPSGHAGQRRR